MSGSQLRFGQPVPVRHKMAAVKMMGGGDAAA